MANIKEMTATELKQFLSVNRNNDEAFNEALSELINRSSTTQRYPADMTPEEIEQVIRKQIEKNRK
ncbi:DUF6887 family protein [Gloeocapsa sp. PCC 7428]|uniref:DUF6887 family protein n=1 Tax=Gloeocapsa sp. PCC 7428 TaxID=1173026 RepID=UPI00030A5F87|nr:hypothetical protein [Gloeocapsa sp. PCC 7428]